MSQPIEKLLPVTPERIRKRPPKSRCNCSSWKPVLRTKGYLKNEDIRRVLGVSLSKARDIAQRLVIAGWLEPHGERRWKRYTVQSSIETSHEPIEMSHKIPGQGKPRNRGKHNESTD